MMHSKVKILFAINCMNIGGAPTVVYNQIKLIDKKKFDPHLLVLYPSKPANYLQKIEGLIGEDKIFNFQYKRKSKFDFKTTYKVYQLLRKKDFDIVFTHLFLANFVVRLAAVFARSKKIVSFEHSMYFDKKKWQTYVDRFLSIFTERIIVSTKEVQKFTIAQQKLTNDKCVVVRNPVSLPEPNNTLIKNIKNKFNIKDEMLVFVTVGRFSKVKGHRVLFDAIKKVETKLGNCRFLIVGHGPEEIELRDYSSKNNIDDLVEIIHDPVNAAQYLYLADCFVLPSLREGQAMAAEEAVRAGLPVISSDLEGMGNLVENGINGYTFSVSDSSDLSKKILKVKENKKESLLLAEGSKKKSESLEKNSDIIKILEYELLR